MEWWWFKWESREDDNNGSHIAFTSSLVTIENLAIKKTTEFFVTDFTVKSVAINENCSNAGIDSDSDEESEVDEEACQDAYENVYAQWLKVCDENHAFISKSSTLVE